MSRFGWGSWVTTGSLVGLTIGVLLGSLIHASGHPVLIAFSDAVEPLGAVWVRGLRMTILPLISSLLIVAIITGTGGRAVGRMGSAAMALFVLFLFLAAFYAVPLGRVLIAQINVESGILESVQEAFPGVPPPQVELPAADGAILEWVAGLIPTNPFAAAVEDRLLQLIIFAVLFAVAANRLPVEHKNRLMVFFGAVQDATFVIVGWALKLTPIGVFALALSFARDAGLSLGGAIVEYVVINSSMTFTFTLLLYVITVAIGRVRPATFARAVYPAQMVAIATRSSLATLPGLMEGARSVLRLPERIIGFALPLSASLFKVNVPITTPVQLYFLTHLYGLPLSWEQILLFVVTLMLLSFVSVGLPTGSGGMVSLPAYLAVGIPFEGYLLIRAIDVIPDVFKTLVNTTSYMTVATLLARRSGQATETALEGVPIS